MSSSCCPADAWGELKRDNYEPSGSIIRLPATELDVYRSAPSDEKTTRCIVWNYDIFGIDGGRSKQLADLMAQQGYLVLMPDYYRGTYCDPSKAKDGELPQFLKEHTNWEEKLKLDWEQSVLPYAQSQGAKVFGCIGTCWGTYPVMKLSAYSDMKAGVSMHPSHPGICGVLAEDEDKLLQGVKCAQLFMPASGDSATTKMGGLATEVLGDRARVREFPDMQHGWVTRGDLKIANVERDVRAAMEEAIAFFNEHVK